MSASSKLDYHENNEDREVMVLRQSDEGLNQANVSDDDDISYHPTIARTTDERLHVAWSSFDAETELWSLKYRLHHRCGLGRTP